VYFNGASASGQYFVAATARRHNGLVQTLLYIRVSICKGFLFVIGLHFVVRVCKKNMDLHI